MGMVRLKAIGLAFEFALIFPAGASGFKIKLVSINRRFFDLPTFCENAVELNLTRILPGTTDWACADMAIEANREIIMHRIIAHTLPSKIANPIGKNQIKPRAFNSKYLLIVLIVNFSGGVNKAWIP